MLVTALLEIIDLLDNIMRPKVLQFKINNDKLNTITVAITR